LDHDRAADGDDVGASPWPEHALDTSVVIGEPD
jgi:hypothetical protein